MSNPSLPDETVGGFHVRHVAGDVTFLAAGNIVAGNQTVINHIRQVVEKARRNVAKTPYKFLAYYDIPDRDIFYGRDSIIEELAGRVARHKVVLLNGTAGSGKTSLINAGLIPRLADDGYTYVRFRDYTDPLAKDLVAQKDWSDAMIAAGSVVVKQLGDYFISTPEFGIDNTSLTLPDLFKAARRSRGVHRVVVSMSALLKAVPPVAVKTRVGLHQI
jgi:hypothetical protein